MPPEAASPLLALAAFAARLFPLPLKKAIYHSGPVSRWIRRRLNQAVPQGLVQVTVAAGGLAGVPLLLDLQLEKDYWLGTYEPELQEAVQHYIQPGWVVYDVGANIGYISLLLARAVGTGGRVFAFEALPANVSRLEKNLALSPLGQRVQPIGAAVADKTGSLRFLVHASTSMGKVSGSAGRAEVYQQEIIVAGVSLDDFVYTQGNPLPQAIKMDIEGSEIFAIQGMRRLLREASPLLLIELHGPEAAQAVGRPLLEQGYTLLRMQKGYPILSSLDELDWKTYVIAHKNFSRRY